MAFLKVNNCVLPAKINTPDINYLKIKDENDTFNGNKRGVLGGRKLNISFETRRLKRKESKAWQGLLQGRGHYWSFDDDVYSSKGLWPEGGYQLRQGDQGKFDEAIVIPDEGSISYDVGYTNEWSIAVWKGNYGEPTKAFYGAQPAWFAFSDKPEIHHYVVTSEGNTYFNGSLNNSVTTDFILMSSGIATFSDPEIRQILLDDLIIVPYVLTEDMIKAFYSFGEPLSNLPRLKLDGDAIRNTRRTAEGVFDNAKSAPFGNSYGFYTDGEILKGEFIEV